MDETGETAALGHTVASSDETDGKYKDVNTAAAVTLNVSDPEGS